MTKNISILSLLILLTGCMSTQEKPIADDPYYAPIYPEQAPVNIVKTGSLFNISRVENLYADVKARQVGDIIEVVLSESTTAQKQANTDTTKENTSTLSPITGLNGRNATIGGNSLEFGFDQSNEFEGSSNSDQSNSLSGSISVNVVQVLNNGNLIVRGEKWITINNGDEFIRINGIIRPQDINADNQVNSIKVANARIQYSGTGSFAETQKAGWLARFFNSSWWPL